MTNKEIVGIVGSRTIGENFRDIQNQICWTGSYLTIYDMNNIILYDRFPVPALYNYDVNTAEEPVSIFDRKSYEITT